jgi:uncharacterized membrane protein
MSTVANDAEIASSSCATDRSAKRVVPIDAIRGMAMFFTCLAHFAGWLQDGYPQLGDFLARCGRIGTPLFLLLSGAMISFVQLREGRASKASRAALLDRGLFILIVGHLAIVLAGAHRTEGFQATLLSSFTIDAIGIACILVALLPTQCALRWAPGAAMLTFLLSWVTALSWHPTDSALIVMKQVLFGLLDGDLKTAHGYVPLLPDVAICIMGIPLGQLWARQVARDDGFAMVGKWMLQIGLAAALTGLALKTMRVVFDLNDETDWSRVVVLSLSVYQKIPPSPNYLLFFAGCGIALSGLALLGWRRQRLTSALRILADVGRASLFVYVAQFLVIWALPNALGITPDRYSGLLFLVELLFLWWLARCWNAIDGNRWYTLGLVRRLAAPVVVRR